MARAAANALSCAWHGDVRVNVADGWIEAEDGERFNAYWKAFTDMKYVDTIRDLAEEIGEGPWAEMDLPVTFRIAPPQQGGKHERAIEIELLDA